VAGSDSSTGENRFSTYDLSSLALQEATNVLAQEGFWEVTAEDSATVSISEFRTKFDPSAPDRPIHLGGGASITGNLATESETGTMVNEHTTVKERVEGDSETKQSLG
jgi:hypothetical protein